MLKKKFLLFSLLISLALIFHLFSSGKELKKISLEEVLSVGNLDDDALFQWAGVVVDTKGYTYVTDSMDYSLKKFDPQGKLIKKVGRKGQGPGEFMAPRLLDCSEKFLYVTDQYIPGLQVFDKELNFKRRLSIKMPISDLKVLSDSQIAVATLLANKVASIFIYNAGGELIREFRYSEKKLPLMMEMVSFDFDTEGNLYVAYTFQDRIEKFNKDEKKLWSEKLLKVKKVKREKVASYVVPTEVVYKDVALDTSGDLFVLGGHLSKNKSRDVYVLSPEGKYLTTFSLPDSSHCIYIDENNFLYSRANEGVTIKKFRMCYEYE